MSESFQCQASELVVKVQWSWGGSKVVTVDANAPLGESLSRFGFIPSSPENSQLIYACNGKALRGDLSFGFQGVKNGNLIICHDKTIRPKTSDRKRKFLESLKHRPMYNYEDEESKRFAKQTAKIEEARRVEISRLNDITFSSYEMMIEYPMLLKDMLKSEEEEEFKAKPSFMQNSPLSMSGSDSSLVKTVIGKTPDEPIDRPLPNPFSRKNFISNKPYVKSMADIAKMSRTERKDHITSTGLYGNVKKDE